MSKDKKTPPSQDTKSESKSEEQKKREAKAKKRAQEQDNQVSKLRAKEFRRSGSERGFNKDLVADKSWHTASGLAHTEHQQGEGDKESEVLPVSDIEPSQTSVSPSEKVAKTRAEVSDDTGENEKSQSTQDHRGGHHLVAASSHTDSGTYTPLSNISGVSKIIAPALLPVFKHLAEHHTNDIDALSHSTTTTSSQNPSEQLESTSHPLHIVSSMRHAVVKEDTSQDQVAGQLTTSGDGSQSVIWSVENKGGHYGELTLDSHSGEWVYHLDNQRASTNALAEGEHKTEQFVVVATDNHGKTLSTVISVEVDGSNDRPVISGVHSGSVNEHGVIDEAVGQLIAVDPDHGDNVTWGVVQPKGSFGELYIDASSGEWRYQLDNQAPSTAALTDRQVATETFLVTATDSSGVPVEQTVTISVHGTNQSATVSGIFTGSVTEDLVSPSGHLEAQGQLSVIDPDSGENAFTPEILTGKYGQIDIDAHGHWVYTADNNNATIQSLKGGEQLKEVLYVHTIDGTSQAISITVSGTNDKAVISGVTTGTLKEDVITDYQGKLDVIDTDAGQSGFVEQPNTQGQYGVFTIDSDGLWHYVLDNQHTKVQGLNEGQQLTETFTVKTLDGTSREIQVNIQGTDETSSSSHTTTTQQVGGGNPTTQAPNTVTPTFAHGSNVPNQPDSNVNHAPIIFSTSTVDVDEDGKTVQGQIHASDVDTGDQLHFSSGRVDGFTLHADGSWSFDPGHSAYQHLAQGQTEILTIPVTVTDNAGATDTQNLTITVTGTNDGAVISGAGAQLKEDSAVSASGDLEASGQLTVQDVDSGEASFTPITDVASDSGYGHFSLSADGQWQYHADNNQPAIQQLAEGEPLTDSITVTSVDGTPHTISVTIEGTNDAPIVAHTITSQQVDEDSAFSFTVPSDTFNDIDIGDTMTLSTGTLPTWLHFDASTGTFSGTPTNSDVGSTSVTVTATDDHGAQVSTTFDLTVNNVNDAPTLTPIASVSVDEDGQKASGQFIATDPDVGDTLSYSIANPVSGLTFNPDGSWVFDPTDAAYQSLPAGQSQTFTIPVTVTDTAGATDVQNLVITVNGTNDGARMGGLSQHMVSEDLNVNHGELIANGRLAVLDVDSGESHITAQSVTGQYGRFSIDEQGHWTYSADNSNPAIQALGQNGQGEIVERFTVSSADGSASRDVVVRIMGTNDGPVVNHAISGAVADEDTAFSFTVPSDTFTDIDIGDTITLSTGTLPTWLHFDASTGTFSGTPTNSDVGSVPISVTATDSQGASVTTQFNLTVNNTNDAPVMTPIASVSVDEDGQKASGQLIATDPDVGDTLSYSIASPVSGLTFNPDGSWVFDPTDAAYQSLPAGQSQTLTIPITVTDAAGATDVQNLVITVNGTNDGAVISGAGAQLKEDSAVSASGELQASGQLTIQDVDSGEAAFTPITDVTSDSGYGHFSLSTDGQWQYHADNNQPAIQQLAAGEPLTDSITVTSVDGTPHTISVTIEGTNDAPIVAHTITSQQVDEDSALQFTLPSDTFGDIDHGDTLTLSTGSLPTWLHFDAATGTFSGTPTNSDVGSTSVTVTATDDHGAQVSTTFDLTVNNVNDAPTLTPIASVSVDEDGQQASGQLIATDPDVGDTLSYSIANPVSGLTFNPDGSWVFDPTDAAYQSLPAGQSQTLTIPVTVTDTAGATDVQNLVITVNGTNDGAVISGAGAQLKEDTAVSASGELQASGQLTVQDVDSGEAAFTPITDVTSDSGYGHFSLSTDGQWQYHADNNQPAIQQLAVGEPLTDSIIVTSVDGTTHTISVTIAGTNDAPIVVHTITSQQVDEDSAFSFTVPSDTFNDIDIGDTMTLSTGTLPTWLHFDAATGTFSGTPTNSDVGSVPINVTATDSQGASVTTQFNLTVNNTNDAPILTPIASVSVDEDGQQASGQFIATDPDVGDTLSYSIANPVSGLTFNPDGSWVFDPTDAAYQSLPAGQSQTLTIPVTVTDKAGATDVQNLVITVNGTNDGAVISGAGAQLKEDSAVSASGELEANGQLTVQDVDSGEAAFTPITDVTSDSGYGHFSLSTDGQWQYHADNNQPAIQQLAAGEPLTDSITVTSVDGTPHTISVTIEGTNDAPIVAHTITSQQVDEDSALQFTLPSDTFGDIDHGDTLTLSTGSLPTWLHFDASTGTFSGTPTNSDVGSVPISVTATDSQGASVTTQFNLTVNNTNDAPVMTPIASVSVDEDGQKASGQLIATDPDTGDTLSYSIANPVSGLTFKPDGSWVFDPTDAAYQSLPAAQSQTLTIPVTVTDAAGATDVQNLVITVNGTNDGAVISGAGAQLKEDSAVSTSGDLEASGQLTVQDVDSGEAAFTPITDVISDSGYGHFSLSADGQWQYHADNNQPDIQQLAAGEPLTDSITVTSVDGTPHTISVTIEGTNDAPIVAHNVVNQQINEDSAFSFTVPSDTFGDIDHGDTLTLSTGSLPTWLHFDASTGTFSGTPTNSDVGSVPISVTATDSQGASVTTQFNLTVNNTNDAPVMTPMASVSVDEDGQKASGQLIATDPDVGDTLSYSIANPVSGLTFNSDGSWVFDPTDAAYQSLPAGQSQTLTIPVTVTDTAGATDVQDLVIIVNGTNDGAVISGAGAQLKEDSAVSASGELEANGQLTIQDVDSGEAAFTPITDVISDSGYGHFSLSADGQWQYHADNNQPAIQQLAAGEPLTDSITVTSIDGTPHTISVTIEGTDDAPIVAHSIASQQVDEDSALQFTLPTDTFGDIDHGDTLTLSTGSLPTWLHFDASTGTFSGTPTNSDVGSTPVTVTATDNHGAQVSTTFDLTVNNVNDAPTLTPIASVSVDEDGQQASGQFIATDPDVGDTLSYSIASPVSGLTFNPDGSWVFDPTDAAYQSLPAGQSQTLTIPITVTDAAGATDVQDLVITVNGTNDGAVISGAGAQLKEDSAVSASGELEANGQLTVQDVDSGEAAFTPITDVTSDSGYGHFSLSADGQWQYHADNNQPAIQQLATGEPLTDSITVTSVDGTPHTISVTIEGTNDAPIVAHSVVNQQINEDSAFSFTVPSDTFNDIDIGDTLTLSTGSLPMWLHFDASTGTFSGTPTNSDVGSTQVTVTATDNHGAQISTTFDLTVNNVNDAPTLTPIASVSVDEDGQKASGQLIATDPDVGDTLSYSIANPVSGLTFNSDGSWVFDPTDAAYQSLPAGQSQTLTIPVTVTDNTGATDTQDLTIIVTGTNDVPTLTVHTQGMTTGTLVENDVDNSDTHTFGVSQPSGLFGDLALNPQTGAYVYTQHTTVTGMTYQASSQTYSGQDTFEVQVSDNHGGTETKYLTFDVSGTLSAPVAGTTQPTIQTQVLAPPVLTTTVASSHVVTPSLTNAVTLQLDVTSDSGVSDQDHITNDDTPTIVGTTSIPFSAVTISENGVVVANALSDGSGHYQVTLPQLPESTHQLVASAVDPSGSGTGQSSVLDIEIDTTPPPVSITLDPITSDDVLNHSELSSVVSVGGSVGSEVSPGSVVTLDIGGSSYDAVVDTNHRFAVDVPGGVLGANSEIVASVSAEDVAGNKSTVTDTHQYSVDDSASIDIDLISGDNMLDPTEHHEDLVVSGTVNGVEDGQIVNISLGGQDYQATVVNQQWSTTVDATDISALPGGLNSVIATVVDHAGNSASSTSPLFIPDTTNPVPSMSFLKPPTPTGGGGIGSHISGDLVVPPLLQQLMPTQQGGGWAISDGQGHTMTSLKGQYGTLTIDPNTGHVEYIYSDAPVPGDKTAGGTHWAGQTSSEEHHDLFQIVYHDVHASNVDVKVNLDVTYVHGHSGHNQESTHLVDMTVTSASGVSPAPPASQHDEVGTDIEPVAEFTVLLSDDVTGADYASQSDSPLHKALPADDQTRPVDHYLNMVGLSPSEVAPAAETKLDHYLHSSTQLVDDLSDVNPVPNHDADLSDALVHDHDKDLAKAHDKGLEETPDNHDHHSDDDLLNSGLNDMHNQI
ncbi:VCBS domain-containing protein [Vibrio natriegens]|uniref:VCBS domain-containing protein n=1 Tax=Vibrio natriegens TaxID=691 RepID=UPI003556C1C9